MSHHIFSVYDTKAEAYLIPFFLPEIAQAERMFGDTCNDTEHLFYLHPEDFTLFVLGTFDERTANIALFDTPKPVCRAIEMKKGTTLQNLMPPEAAEEKKHA